MNPMPDRFAQRSAAAPATCGVARDLLEIAARTEFSNEFTHISECDSRASELLASAQFSSLRHATLAPGPLERNDVPALRRSRLSWVNQNYIRNETLTAANACLVAAQNRIPLVRHWGGGEVASADGLRFVVPIRTVHAGPNPKYFGMGHGVTYYNLVSNQFTGLNGIVVPARCATAWCCSPWCWNNRQSSIQLRS